MCYYYYYYYYYCYYYVCVCVCVCEATPGTRRAVQARRGMSPRGACLPAAARGPAASGKCVGEGACRLRCGSLLRGRRRAPRPAGTVKARRRSLARQARVGVRCAAFVANPACAGRRRVRRRSLVSGLLPKVQALIDGRRILLRSQTSATPMSRGDRALPTIRAARAHLVRLQKRRCLHR